MQPVVGDTLFNVRTSTFLSSLFLVFLILVLPFLLFGFLIFVYFVSCSQWTEQMSDYQRSDHIQCYSQCSLFFLLSTLCCVLMELGKIPLVYLLESAQGSFANAVSLCQYHLSYLDVSVTRCIFSPTQYLDNGVYWLYLIKSFCTYIKEFWRKSLQPPRKPVQVKFDVWHMLACSHSLWF